MEKRKLLEVEAQQIRNRTYLTAASMRVLSMFDIAKTWLDVASDNKIY